jgi:hypothetical protein
MNSIMPHSAMRGRLKTAAWAVSAGPAHGQGRPGQPNWAGRVGHAVVVTASRLAVVARLPHTFRWCKHRKIFTYDVVEVRGVGRAR